MKACFVFLLAYLASCASAFGLYGGYERMFYWYAYRLDVELHGGRAKTIAVGCDRQRACNFLRFIQYINKNPGATIPEITGNQEPRSVDEGAHLLEKNGLTKAYDCDRIHTTSSGGRVEKLIVNVCRAVAGWNQNSDGMNQGLYDQVKASRDRVQLLREAEQKRSVGEMVNEEFNAELAVFDDKQQLGNTRYDLHNCNWPKTEQEVRDHIKDPKWKIGGMVEKWARSKKGKPHDRVLKGLTEAGFELC